MTPFDARNTENGSLRPAPRGNAWLRSLFVQNPRLLARLIAFYRKLRLLPRQQRRQIGRRAAATGVGAALMLALLQLPAHANTITVVNGEVAINKNGKCSLIEAIRIAQNNVNGQPYPDCAAGNPSGPDTINLPADGLFTLEVVHNTNNVGENGLPAISSQTTINGNGSTIQRSSGAPEFRLFYVGPPGNLTLNNVTLVGGRATNDAIAQFQDDAGGGIYNAGFLSLNNSRLRDNAARYGGAVSNSGYLTITTSTLSDNHARRFGGGVANDAGGNATIHRSTLAGNTADDCGGGVWNSFSDFTLVNSTISGNQADEEGGGLCNGQNDDFYYYSGMTVTNTTITQNIAGDNGGGIYNLGTLALNRVLVSGNRAPNGRELFHDEAPGGSSAAVNANNFNVFGRSNNAGVSGFTPGANDIVPSVAQRRVVKPKLANNGGPTQTHALPLGSPALDRAPNDQCNAAPVNGIDQRGSPRNQNGSGGPSSNECDVGAFEL